VIQLVDTPVFFKAVLVQVNIFNIVNEMLKHLFCKFLKINFNDSQQKLYFAFKKSLVNLSLNWILIANTSLQVYSKN